MIWLYIRYDDNDLVMMMQKKKNLVVFGDLVLFQWMDLLMNGLIVVVVVVEDLLMNGLIVVVVVEDLLMNGLMSFVHFCVHSSQHLDHHLVLSDFHSPYDCNY